MDYISEVEFIQTIVQDVSRKLTGTFEGFTGEINNQSQVDGDHELVNDVRFLKYDAFLSFDIGDDTVMNFTNRLYKALCRKKIHTFKLENEHQCDKGKDVPPKFLLQAMKYSRLFIIVLSTNYVASSWCLDQLVHILECRGTSVTRKVFPIFYNVDSSMFQHQTNSYENSFAAHEENYKHNPEKVERWRSALAEVCNLPVKGDLNNGHEKKFITDIVGTITRKLNKRATIIRKRELVGIDSRVQELLSILDTSVKDVHIIGIWGMAGVGKKTLAYFIYEKIYDQYEACFFLANVTESSEKGYLVYLQKKLLAGLEGEPILVNDLQHGIEQIRQHFCNVKCLIVLNGVNKLEQLDALVGEANWFGLGSRIIITTRDAHLLNSKGVNKIYTCKGLNPAEAMELLCLNAFKQKQPLDGYEMFCNRFLEYANGNPLTLIAIGSFLRDKSIKEWKNTLRRKYTYPHKDILNVLQRSYDSLDEELKEMFLDIVCFFNGKKVDRVLEVLDCCGYHAKIGMAILIDKSLVTVSNNILCLPEWVQQIGRQIVHKESPRRPGEQSRLWDHKDISGVMKCNGVRVHVQSLSHSIDRKIIFFFLLHPAYLLLLDIRKQEKLKQWSWTNLNYNAAGGTPKLLHGCIISDCLVFVAK
nr:disease resistance protein RPV1-like [Ziziphus jujuba var. spinosa]